MQTSSETTFKDFAKQIWAIEVKLQNAISGILEEIVVPREVELSGIDIQLIEVPQVGVSGRRYVMGKPRILLQLQLRLSI